MPLYLLFININTKAGLIAETCSSAETNVRKLSVQKGFSGSAMEKESISVSEQRISEEMGKNLEARIFLNGCRSPLNEGRSEVASHADDFHYSVAGDAVDPVKCDGSSKEMTTSIVTFDAKRLYSVKIVKRFVKYSFASFPFVPDRVAFQIFRSNATKEILASNNPKAINFFKCGKCPIRGQLALF